MHPYLEPLEQKFQANRDKIVAVQMKKYMKGQYDYYGIKSPLRREIMKAHLLQYGLPVKEDVDAITKACWTQPQREFQYFIMEVLGKIAKKADPIRIELYEYMAVNKSWWDTIDYIASNLVGVHFQKYPEQINPHTEQWMDSGNIWLQRISLLFQLKYRSKTDIDLMTHYIEQLLGSKEFFINKAIGWILREYSKTNPEWVVSYVRNNEHRLAGLSRREALKWLERKEKSGSK
ncbi:MAG: DNA alkylation repair protein [Bacteroidetes bacterium]|nr:DNA alkylation repair protein [Bacteroidota bacterium]